MNIVVGCAIGCSSCYVRNNCSRFHITVLLLWERITLQNPSGGGVIQPKILENCGINITDK